MVMVGLVWMGWQFGDEGPARYRPREAARTVGASRQLAMVTVVALCLIAWPRAYAALLEREPSGQAGRLVLPEAVVPWRAGEPTPHCHPHFPPPDLTPLPSFHALTRRVHLF